MSTNRCGKINFSSKAEALIYIKAARLSSKRRTKTGRGTFSGRSTPYKCCYCDGWHMTSNSRKQAKSAARKHKERSSN